MITEPLTDEAQPFSDLMQLLDDACALMTRQWEKTQGWHSLLVPEITRRLNSHPESTSDLRTHALVGSALSCLNATTDAWTACGGTTPVSELLDHAMNVLIEPPA
ncbi:hypothetical protein [Nocardia fluminea]|uniref:hypothetical protein n=1 Tax=Nocardia fluminea TaxID=134984 RepID=UPI0033D5F45A